MIGTSLHNSAPINSKSCPHILLTSVVCQTSRILPVFNHSYSTQFSQFLDDDVKGSVAPQGLRRLYVFGLAEHGALGYTTQVGNKRRRQLPHKYFKNPIRLHFGHYYRVCLFGEKCNKLGNLLMWPRINRDKTS
ncbi:uncharacterized protein LOC108253946 [Diaphorina citri]|uniref:Uncharacterized protein LOC108253946 n=1 Tax=Diaphorina citri TaxID=121845 RepID=A0A1S4EQ22_DIACI|nr:uncharacterized protein LOC108253946 [Diaphorina citri]